MTTYENALSPSDAAAAKAASLLAGHPDYQILRRLGNATQLVSVVPPNTPTRIAAVVDVETTGLNPDGDRIIELAIQQFRFTDAGRITKVGTPRIWREDPGFPLDPAIVKLTGLTDADLAGEAIDDDKVTGILNCSDAIIAHNASFDGSFIEARLPRAAGLNWACTLNDIAWSDQGFGGRQLGHLLMEAAYFFAGHRAAQDVLAGIHLLAHKLPTGLLLLAALIARAEEPSVRIDASGAPFAHKDLLKARRYRYEPGARYWWTEVAKTGEGAELLWLQCCFRRSRPSFPR